MSEYSITLTGELMCVTTGAKNDQWFIGDVEVTFATEDQALMRTPHMVPIKLSVNDKNEVFPCGDRRHYVTV